MKKLIQSENEVKRDVINYLKLKGYLVYRINNGAVYRKKQDCYTFSGMPGVPDLIAINKEMNKMLFIELKGTKGVASEAQKKFIDMVNRVTSAKGMIVNSLEDLLKQL